MRPYLTFIYCSPTWKSADPVLLPFRRAPPPHTSHPHLVVLRGLCRWGCVCCFMEGLSGYPNKSSFDDGEMGWVTEREEEETESGDSGVLGK